MLSSRSVQGKYELDHDSKAGSLDCVARRPAVSGVPQSSTVRRSLRASGRVPGPVELHQNCVSRGQESPGVSDFRLDARIAHRAFSTSKKPQSPRYLSFLRKTQVDLEVASDTKRNVILLTALMSGPKRRWGRVTGSDRESERGRPVGFEVVIVRVGSNAGIRLSSR